LVQEEYQEEQACDKRQCKINNNNKSKSLRQYLSNIAGTHEIMEMQKTAILGTAHKLREVLM
jgi:hypothetical protein